MDLKMSYLIVIFFAFGIANSQVGIGTSNPQGRLDITASDEIAPESNDGLLVPRIQNFPSTDPTDAQDSMIVYLTTTSGSNTPGFYFWNHSSGTWTQLNAPFTNWSLEGNSGIDDASEFLGTTDLKNLNFRTNNVLRARFTTNGNLELLNTGQSVLLGEGAGAVQNNSATRRNVLIGYQAGNDITTAVNNTAVGWKSLDAATTSAVNNNVALGQHTLGALNDGSGNVALGVSSMFKITNAENNVAIGLNAMSNSTSGNNNVAIGISAGSNMDADDNVFIGANADAFNNGTSGKNVIIGTRAGESGVSGTSGGVNFTGRIMIGYEAGGDARINNSLFIENSSSISPLIGGDFSSDRLAVNVDMTTLGTGNFIRTLNVNGDVYADTYYSSSTSYPDYVFEDYFKGSSKINSAYTFTPLEKAISFVRDNGHLINVKSYEDYKNDGGTINVAETSIKNLEKIEENFLYISELKAENDALKTRIENLEKLINAYIKKK